MPNPIFLLAIAWCAGAAIGVGTIEVSGRSFDDAPFEAASCGRSLVPNSESDPVLRAGSTRVVLALDEEWRELYGDNAPSVARSLLWQASSLFRGLHIHLLPVRVVQWNSPNSEVSARALLNSARVGVSLTDGDDMVVALTAQPLTQGDGHSEIGGRYALASHHPKRPARDATVLAHEIAHVFGATHGCDLPRRGGLMAERGFNDPDLICPCTRNILDMNAARFHQ